MAMTTKGTSLGLVALLCVAAAIAMSAAETATETSTWRLRRADAAMAGGRRRPLGFASSSSTSSSSSSSSSSASSSSSSSSSSSGGGSSSSSTFTSTTVNGRTNTSSSFSSSSGGGSSSTTSSSSSSSGGGRGGGSSGGRGSNGGGGGGSSGGRGSNGGGSSSGGGGGSMAETLMIEEVTTVNEAASAIRAEIEKGTLEGVKTIGAAAGNGKMDIITEGLFLVFTESDDGDVVLRDQTAQSIERALTNGDTAATAFAIAIDKAVRRGGCDKIQPELRAAFSEALRKGSTRAFADVLDFNMQVMECLFPSCSDRRFSCCRTGGFLTCLSFREFKSTPRKIYRCNFCQERFCMCEP